MSAALQGKCALITGSTQGLGLAAALCFAEAGAHLILNGFGHPEEIRAIGEQVEEHGVQALYCGADLRHPAEIEQMVEQATARFGAIDILVNNAVVRHADPVEAFPIAKWDESLAVNLSAAFHAIRLVVPGMRRRNWGRIINVASIYSFRAAVNRVAYVTTKTALVGLTRAVALETVGQDITCNAICPGTTLTPPHEAAISASVEAGSSRVEAEQSFLAGKQPTGRFIHGGDVAALMVFLCRPEARDITGAALPVDGGWSVS